MKGNTTSWVFVVVAITWMILEPTCDAAADLTLDLKGSSSDAYSKLLNDIRDKVKDPKLKYGGTALPVVAAPKNPAVYLYIDLKAERGTITAAFSKNDLYLTGYLDNIDGVKKAHFFQGADANAFPEVKDPKNRVRMRFKESYKDLEKNAGGDRSRFGLGVVPLNKYINKLYQEKKLDVKNEAQLMLVIIQTIAEAARFKYIEKNIVQKFADAYNPDTKAKTLQNNWATTTKAIKDSKNGVINPPLVLKGAGTWSQVSKLAEEMGLLKYLGN